MNIQSYAVLGLDHLFVVIFAIAYPVYGFIGYRKCAHKLVSGELSRRTEYIHNLTVQ